MDRMKFTHSTIVFLVVLFTKCSCQEDTECTSGFFDPLHEEKYVGHTPISLLGGDGPEQWIFPRMTFTCQGLLTTWIFRGFGGRDDELQLTTWRPDPLIDTFRRVSRTNSSVANVTVSENGSVFTYELNSPLQIEPGDIVGVEVVSNSPRNTKNILSLDVTDKGKGFLSYMRPFRFNLGFRPRDIYEQYRAALINVVIENVTVVATRTPDGQDSAPGGQNTTAAPGGQEATDNRTEVTNSDERPVLNRLVDLTAFKVGIAACDLVIILAVVIMCISVVWIVKCVRSRRRKRRRENQKSIELGETTVNNHNSWPPLQQNTAYRKFSDVVQTSLNQEECFKKLDTTDPETQSGIYETIDSGYEKIDEETSKSMGDYEMYAVADSISIVLLQTREKHDSTIECEVYESDISEEGDSETVSRGKECESLTDCEAYTLTYSMRSNEGTDLVESPRYVEEDNDSEEENMNEMNKRNTTLITANESQTTTDSNEHTQTWKIDCPRPPYSDQNSYVD